MAQPLTDSINALTRYANSVTGASDTTLSEAVATLANGYGQGGGDFETGVYVGDGNTHSSYINIPVSKQYSNFALLVEDNTSHASGDFVGCWGTPTMYIGVKWTSNGVASQVSSDSRGVYLKFSATKIQFIPAVNGGYCKMILDKNYRWIAW